jgi:hypothetical protein
MSDSTPAPTFGLDRVLAALRDDLLAAETAASKGSYGLGIKEAEVELSFTVGQANEAGGKLDFRVFGVGVGAGATRSKTDSSVHRISLRLVPVSGSADRAVAGEQPAHHQ